jgi:hypothetical protein
MYDGRLVGCARELLRPHPEAAAEGAPPGGPEILQRLITGLQAGPRSILCPVPPRRCCLRSGSAGYGVPLCAPARWCEGERGRSSGRAVSICFRLRLPRVRVPSAPPVRPFGTFFSLPSAAAGTPENARLSAHLSESMRTGFEAHFGPFPVSLRPLSPTQPNHRHLGTDVGSSIVQWVGGRPKRAGLKKPPPRRIEQGSNYPVQCARFRQRSGHVLGRP